MSESKERFPLVFAAVLWIGAVVAGSYDKPGISVALCTFIICMFIIEGWSHK